MPAWITSLLRELVCVPMAAQASSTSTSRPRQCQRAATARPTTPAPPPRSPRAPGMGVGMHQCSSSASPSVRSTSWRPGGTVRCARASTAFQAKGKTNQAGGCLAIAIAPGFADQRHAHVGHAAIMAAQVDAAQRAGGIAQTPHAAGAGIRWRWRQPGRSRRGGFGIGAAPQFQTPDAAAGAGVRSVIVPVWSGNSVMSPCNSCSFTMANADTRVASAARPVSLRSAQPTANSASALAAAARKNRDCCNAMSISSLQPLRPKRAGTFAAAVYHVSQNNSATRHG